MLNFTSLIYSAQISGGSRISPRGHQLLLRVYQVIIFAIFCQKLHKKEDCIPVGCIPTANWPYLGWRGSQCRCPEEGDRCSSGSKGGGGMAPLSPVKISHKKMAAEGACIDFMFLALPYPTAGSATAPWTEWHTHVKTLHSPILLLR